MIVDFYVGSVIASQKFPRVLRYCSTISLRIGKQYTFKKDYCRTQISLYTKFQYESAVLMRGFGWYQLSSLAGLSIVFNIKSSMSQHEETNNEWAGPAHQCVHFRDFSWGWLQIIIQMWGYCSTYMRTYDVVEYSGMTTLSRLSLLNECQRGICSGSITASRIQAGTHCGIFQWLLSCYHFPAHSVQHSAILAVKLICVERGCCGR